MKLFSHPVEGTLSLVQKPGFRPLPNPYWRVREAKTTRINPFPTLVVNPDHCIEQSKHDFTKLEWFPDEKQAALDSRRLINPDQYLTRFHPEITDQEPLLRPFKPFTFKISQTREEAIEAYRRNGLGCIANSTNGQQLRYAGAYCLDLRVAYTEDGDCKTIVWPKKKIYGRVYSKNNGPKFTAVLKNTGYREAYSFDSPHKKEWVGAKFEILPDDDPPYWDHYGNIINGEVVG